MFLHIYLGNSMGGYCSQVTWRNADPNLKWNRKFKEALIKEIKEIPTFGSVTPCLLLAGPKAAGKSSLFNTFLNSKNEEKEQKAAIGNDVRNFTYDRYDAAGELKNKYCVCDTAGFLDVIGKGITANDIISVMKGHIAQGYEFDEKEDIQTSNGKYISDPAETVKSHCLVIVLSIKDLRTYLDNYSTKIRYAIRACHEEDIPVCIVLTKVDDMCKLVEEDSSKIFSCSFVKDAVRDASEMFGLPEGYIFPVINHTSQNLKPLEIDIIALLTLRTILQTASDYLEGHEFE